MNRHIREARDVTTAVDAQYKETVTIYDRDFQKYSVDHSVHLVPIDDVRIVFLSHTLDWSGLIRTTG